MIENPKLGQEVWDCRIGGEFFIRHGRLVALHENGQVLIAFFNRGNDWIDLEDLFSSLSEIATTLEMWSDSTKVKKQEEAPVNA